MAIVNKYLLALLLLQVDNLSKEWAANADLPPHVVQMLNNFPETLHPMSQFSAAITAMNSESHFTRAYASGVPKANYWEVNIIKRLNLELSYVDAYMGPYFVVHLLTEVSFLGISYSVVSLEKILQEKCDLEVQTKLCF